jgi:hypothetical protein
MDDASRLDDTDAVIDKRWYDCIADGIRRKRVGADEGTTWVLLLDAERVPVVGMAITPDDAAQTDPAWDGLAHIIGDVDPPAVVLAVTRGDGEPRPGDHRLWEAMRARLAVLRPELVDLIVVGERSWWAVLAGRDDLAA